MSTIWVLYTGTLPTFCTLSFHVTWPPGVVVPALLNSRSSAPMTSFSDWSCAPTGTVVVWLVEQPTCTQWPKSVPPSSVTLTVFV